MLDCLDTYPYRYGEEPDQIQGTLMVGQDYRAYFASATVLVINAWVSSWMRGGSLCRGTLSA